MGPWGQPTYVITHSSPSRHYGSPRTSALEQAGIPARPTLRRWDVSSDGAGILTCFPFGVLELRYPLGPTNPRLTNIAEETWPFRRLGFSPNYAATNTRILVSARSTGPHDPASVHAERLSTESPCGVPWYRWSTLAPSIFRAPNLDW